MPECKRNHTTASTCHGLWLTAALTMLAALGPGLPAAETPARMIAPGTSYRAIHRQQGPVGIHVIELDPSEEYISLACAIAGTVPGRLKVSELAVLASSASRYAVAAVNGDYFVMGGRTDGALFGLNVRDGHLVSAGGGRSALVLLDDGRARVASLRLDAWMQTSTGARVPISAMNQPRGRNDVVLYTPLFGTSTKTSASGREIVLRGVEEPLELGKVYETTVTASTYATGDLALWPEHVALSASGSTAGRLEQIRVGDKVKLCVNLAPDLEGKVVEAVGGGPVLVRDGRISIEREQENFTASHSDRRHPRTAAGIRPDGKVVLVAVDGRQARSVGMTLWELAQLMLDLGCRDAVNLDGGGSTTMWVRGEVVNSPSGGRQRPVGNALLVMSAAPHGPPTRMRITPESVSALPGYRVTVHTEAQDDYYNPVDMPAMGMGWAYEGPIGTVSPRGEFTAAEVAETATGAIKIFCGGVTARIPVTVHARPAALRIAPEAATAAPGQQIRFTVAPFDESGAPISFDPSQVRWQADTAAGMMSGDGVLTAGTGPAGTVNATLAGVTASARVVFATETVPVEGFEDDGACTAFSWPREVPVSCERVTEPVREGTYAARLTYDFTTTDESRAAYFEIKRDVGDALLLHAWVYGDGLGHWLRGKVTDANDHSFNLDFAPRIDWIGWREVTAPVPADAEPPIQWDAIYVSEFHPERQDTGAVVFDALRAERAAAPTQ
ncbi:MAG: phosphodiester glycosidase family protein [Armatimonadota bacterium]|nr:MAG: phosphodiester glycosidase family protein [Armatimonadota bacterium]